MFDPSICIRCDQEFASTYPDRDFCKRCHVLMITPFLCQVARSIGNESIAYVMVPFVCFDYERAARTRFLYLALLARESIFRTKFTFAGNGMRGNISLYENIVDRIFRFV